MLVIHSVLLVYKRIHTNKERMTLYMKPGPVLESKALYSA